MLQAFFFDRRRPEVTVLEPIRFPLALPKKFLENKAILRLETPDLRLEAVGVPV
jgi:hypothetical protein